MANTRPIQSWLFCGYALLLGVPCVAAEETWYEPRVKPLPTQLLGPFARASDGTIVALDAEATLVSSDEGRTWSAPRPLFRPESPSAQNPSPKITVSNERALFRTKSGTLIAAFMNMQEKNWTWQDKLFDAPDARLPTYVMRSTDNGVTWRDVQKLHDDWSGAVRDMLQTRDGRIIFTAMKMLHQPGRHAVLTYSSADDGVTWEGSNLIDLGGQGHHGGVTEPAIVELNDGRVWQLIRTNWGEFWSGYSYDGGRHWRVLQPSGIPASSAPALLRRLASGRLMLLWNRLYPEGKTSYPLRGGDGLWSEVPVSNHREELSLAFSSDEGRTWSKPVVLARNTKTWLAYPYAFEIQPGRIWLTTMQGGVRVQFSESDFISTEAGR